VLSFLAVRYPNLIFLLLGSVRISRGMPGIPSDKKDSYLDKLFFVPAREKFLF